MRSQSDKARIKMTPALGRLEQVNKELWLVLSLFAICLLLNFVVTSQRMVLSFYGLPTIVSAYLYGRRHAALTALASVLLVALMINFSGLFSSADAVAHPPVSLLDVVVWGGVLMVTAYLAGTLYEHKTAQLRELRDTYHGILMILRHFVAKDKYTENHSYRVSVYATRIAAVLDLDPERIEDVRAASLLHDIGKVDVGRELLYKAAKLTEEEYKQMQKHVDRGVELLGPVGGSLRRVLPIVLAHHDKFDGSGYHASRGDEIPIEARVIAVADVYDSLTSDRPYRKAMSPFDAKESIAKGSGTEFDPQVVEAFMTAFSRRELEVPNVMI